jgi:DNA-binding NarL/FixJ family response regulator
MSRRSGRAETGAMVTQRNKVFIVDDSASIRSRLAEMLAQLEGVTVIGEAASANEAIASILRLKPTAVVLDLNLMGRTGIDVLRAVHPQEPDIVFVVLTNHAEPQYRTACTKAGAAYFLDKSCDFDRVPAVIAEIAATRH